MECAFPVLRRIKGTRGYVISPCGVCANCRKNRAHAWGARIYHESRGYLYSTFLTLTYDDEHLPISEQGYNTLEKTAPSLFMKRLRYFLSEDKIRFFCGAEYGSTTFRAHYHLALFGVAPDDKRIFTDFVPADSGFNCRCRAWNNGLANVSELEIGSANYIGGYCLKKIMGKAGQDYYKSRGIEPPFALMSRRPGIGYDYMQKYAQELLRFGNCQVNGHTINLPRYYAEKLNFKETGLYKSLLDERQAQLVEKFNEACMCTEDFQRFIKSNLDQKQQLKWNNEFKERIVIDAKI